MKISLVINADTRAGWLLPFTAIKDYGDNSLCGCRSVDFLNEGVKNKLKFFAGHDIEVILVIDLHEDIPPDVMLTLQEMQLAGEINILVIESFNHSASRWNDRLYLRSLRHATGDYVAHFDGDTSAFRREHYPLIENYLRWLDDGAGFICQQTPLSKEEHQMEHASTRFFICKRETLDLDEAERLLDDHYRSKKFPGRHLPCLEHILGAMCGDTVFYPPCVNDSFVVFSWVHYHAGTLAKLNAMPYEAVAKYVFETCGGPLGASDLIGHPIP